MFQIILPVIIVAAIGLILGLGLSAASKIFAVPVDEKAMAIRECLPGANCGACGFTGCDGYAAALSDGKTADTAKCVPGGTEASRAIAELLGVEACTVVKKSAVVLCQGNSTNVGNKLDYAGVKSCKMAAQLFGGPKECTYGCLGMGDCVNVCSFNAVFICDGVARVNPDSCHACGLCVNTCPRGIIELLPSDLLHSAVLCRNKDKGALTRKACKQGCLACTKCVQVCPEAAVSIEDNCAKVDPELCNGCGKCQEACPTGAINILLL